MPNPSFVIPLFLQSALLPFVLALAALLMLRTPRLARLAPLVAVSLGFLASYVAVYHAQWSFSPQQSLDWLPWIVLLGSAGVVATENAGSAAMRQVGRLAISVGCAALVAWPALASGGLPKAVLPIAATALLMWAAWTYLGATVKQRPTPAPVLAVVAGGAALALMLDASQVIGQLSGALAMTLVACLAFNMPRLRTVFSGTATGLAVLLLGMLLANAYFYAGFALGYVLLLVGGLLADPLVAGINRLRQRHGGVGSWVLTGALAAIPVLTTVGLAIRAAQASGGY
ncbi:hypothetical protein [Rhodoferax sp. UBA5149]|uniref:hypothetical protein n=1 Tax=Rhodoferax sp. UBA5149 TaxID=1947379 RepID=UPI0025DE49CD|nr:hypothetical protein [Rhodoferax sp. UBA5149]